MQCWLVCSEYAKNTNSLTLTTDRARDKRRKKVSLCSTKLEENYEIVCHKIWRYTRVSRPAVQSDPIQRYKVLNCVHVRQLATESLEATSKNVIRERNFNELFPLKFHYILFRNSIYYFASANVHLCTTLCRSYSLHVSCRISPSSTKRNTSIYVWIFVGFFSLWKLWARALKCSSLLFIFIAAIIIHLSCKYLFLVFKLRLERANAWMRHTKSCQRTSRCICILHWIDSVLSTATVSHSRYDDNEVRW